MVADAGDPTAVAVDRDIRVLVWGLARQEQHLLVLPQVTLVEHPERPEVNLSPKGAVVLVLVAHGARACGGGQAPDELDRLCQRDASRHPEQRHLESE